MVSVRRLFAGIYKKCECNCGELIPFLRSDYKPARYKLGHYLKTVDQSGMKHHNYKNGMYDDNNGYVRLLAPNYISSYDDGYCLIHVYVFQEYHQCCMLPWGDVHHIDGDKKHNMSYNLMGMMHDEHARLTNTVDTSCRRCRNLDCPCPNGIYYDKNGKDRWGSDGDGWLCTVCYSRKKYQEKKKLLKQSDQSDCCICIQR